MHHRRLKSCLKTRDDVIMTACCFRDEWIVINSSIDHRDVNRQMQSSRICRHPKAERRSDGMKGGDGTDVAKSELRTVYADRY